MSAAPKSLVVLHSPSYVLKRRELQRLVAEVLGDEDPEYSLEQFWAGDDRTEDIAAAIPSVSLLSDNRAVIVHEFQNLGAREQKALTRPLESIPPGTCVIITTSPRGDRRDKKPPLAAEIGRLAQKIGEVRELPAPRERDLPGWVAQEAMRYGKQIAHPDATTLVNTVGSDLDRLANEIEKLAQYVGTASLITAADVQAASSPMDDRDIFALVDAIGRRDAPGAIDIIRALMPTGAKRGSGLGLLGMIGRQVRLLWQAAYTLNTQRSLSDIPEHIKAVFPDDTALDEAHSFVREKLAAQARNFTEAQLARALVRVYETDLMLKGQSDEKADERTVLELLVVSLCRK